MAFRLPKSTRISDIRGGRKGNRGRAAGQKRGGWLNTPASVRKRINLSMRQVAVALMNDLAERGPRYHGDFMKEWKAVSLTGSGFGPQEPKYPYTIKDIPKLDITAGTMNRVVVFEIFNTSPYAMEAMDLIPGKWEHQVDPPLGGIEYSSKVPGGVLHGYRAKQQTLRWQVSPDKKGPNVSTAEKDWYINYTKGGEMHADVKKAFRFQQQ